MAETHGHDAHFEIKIDRAAMRAGGTTMEQAAANLRAAAQHFDLAEFEALIATHRPELWKRMNRRPSRMTRFLQRFRH